MKIPNIIYGTAWKEEKTKDLVLKALNAGFRAIDTANQRVHYLEAGVGDAWVESGLNRDEIFLQSKFTYQRGQDHRLPYDPSAAFPDQVRQSFQSSLDHLETDYLDSYILHGPYGHGIVEEDKLVWQEMESLVREGKVNFIGISNVTAQQLSLLFDSVKIKPHILQNRCYANVGWDMDVRDFCKDKEINYQGFSLLTANPFVLEDSKVKEIALGLSKTPEQVIFAFCKHIGIIPLTGTTNVEHMGLDLTTDFKLSETDVDYLLKLGVIR